MARRRSTGPGQDPEETDALVEGAAEADATPEEPAVEAESSLEEDLPGDELASELPSPEPYDVADDEAEELDPEAGQENSDQLEEAEAVAAAATSTRPARRPRSDKAPVRKKDAPTRTRREATVVVTEQRTGPVTFVKQSIAELRKVVWPTGSQLSQYFVVVLIFVVFMIALVSVLDFVFGWALLKALG